jgi:hypothetical protein
MIQLPSQAEISYLRRFSVAAIYLIAVPTRPPMVLVGTATNIASSAAALVARRRGLFVAGKPLDIAWAGWLADGAANRLVHAVTSRHGSTLLKMSVKDATIEIAALAARHGVTLADHGTTLARVSNAVGKIRERVEASRQNGTLQRFNAEFKRRRLLAQRTGARFPTYGVVLRRLRTAMAMAAATGGAGTPLAIFDQVFGAD